MSAQAFTARTLQSILVEVFHQSRAAQGVCGMRVTIVNKPTGAFGGMWLQRLQVGQTYNLDPDIAKNLILQGYALKENRWGERRRTPRPESPGRRRTDMEKG